MEALRNVILHGGMDIGIKCWQVGTEVSILAGSQSLKDSGLGLPHLSQSGYLPLENGTVHGTCLFRSLVRKLIRLAQVANVIDTNCDQ